MGSDPSIFWEVSVYSQLEDWYRNIVPVGQLLEQGMP